VAHQTVENMEEEEAVSEGFGTHNESMMNTTYEGVKEEATPTPVDFVAGEKMEFAAHFNNNKFNAEHIRFLFWIHPSKDGMLTFVRIPSALPHSYTRTKRHMTKWPHFPLQSCMSVLSFPANKCKSYKLLK